MSKHILRTRSGLQTAAKASLPQVRVPVRVKITFPYALLALFVAIAAAYLVSRIVLETVEERFTNQLIEMGKLTADWVVQEENRRLETLRLLAHTEGMTAAIANEDAERLRELTLPIAVNYQEEAVDILNMQGRSVLSLYHQEDGDLEDYSFSRGNDVFAQWEFVSQVLDRRVDQGRDKQAGLAQAPWGDYLYLVGPVFDEAGSQVGVILVGKSLSSLVRQIRQDTLAHSTIYNFEGQPLASTLFSFDRTLPPWPTEQAATALDRQGLGSLIRPLTAASITYSEIVGPWEVRDGQDLGLIGAALPQSFLVRPSQITRLQIFLLVTGAFLLVIAVGVYLAKQITSPLLQIVLASAKVAQGDLEVNVEPTGNDEVAVLAHAFNGMVSGLREGSIYRDLLGRTVSPEVREQLRQTFASGDLRLEGQNAQSTVLMTDIRNFTTLSEEVDPPTILAWLNEYFGALVPLITKRGGVVNQFEGDALLAFFGILPRPLPPQESADLACRTALEILNAIEQLNLRRARRGEPPLVTGIGLNTGMVTAGGLGAADRLHYTIIGDTVNTTQRLESFTKQLGQSAVVVSQQTVVALGERRQDFCLEPLGAHQFRGKSAPLEIYRLWPIEVGLREPAR